MSARAQHAHTHTHTHTHTHPLRFPAQRQTRSRRRQRAGRQAAAAAAGLCEMTGPASSAGAERQVTELWCNQRDPFPVFLIKIAITATGETCVLWPRDSKPVHRLRFPYRFLKLLVGNHPAQRTSWDPSLYLPISKCMETLKYAWSSKTKRQTPQNQSTKMGFSHVAKTAWGRMEPCLRLLSERAEVKKEPAKASVLSSSS
ncbi:uncharacterized protein LOC115610393 isoform X2 [Strigops habroptila]|uniref:uncharacterized protein LOC115610393 isoform X2 n=1 Tax=Strigops habroptila TaxID=2489341 RepID=UPI0011CF9E86|nr:uncharacterized protein LOC115610393 isoform X2 [Strigops habroptila]